MDQEDEFIDTKDQEMLIRRTMSSKDLNTFLNTHSKTCWKCRDKLKFKEFYCGNMECKKCFSLVKDK